jgi:hypothetical protein
MIKPWLFSDVRDYRTRAVYQIFEPIGEFVLTVDKEDTSR